jgi:L-ascorbate metabolism protein UlaG (beta-lactamase superfamily)
MIDVPITAADVPRLHAVLVAHSDNDHYSVPTCRDLAPVTGAYCSTRYVASLMTGEGLPAYGHDIGDEFSIGPVRVALTPADHAWQNAYPGTSDRVHQPEDACGFWLETPDGTIWAPGDSRLIREHHLTMPAPDALLFDFSDSEWHFGLDGAIEMANAYPATPLLLHHWGSVDAPAFPPFNADPASLYDRVTDPTRIHVLAPGEPFTLARRRRASVRRHGPECVGSSGASSSPTRTPSAESSRTVAARVSPALDEDGCAASRRSSAATASRAEAMSSILIWSSTSSRRFSQSTNRCRASS